MLRLRRHTQHLATYPHKGLLQQSPTRSQPRSGGYSIATYKLLIAINYWEFWSLPSLGSVSPTQNVAVKINTNPIQSPTHKPLQPPFPQPNTLQKSQFCFSLKNQPANPPLTIKTQRKKSINFPQKNTKKYKIETLRLLGSLEQTKQTI